MAIQPITTREIDVAILSLPAIVAAIGCVNDRPFGGYRPGRLLLVGADTGSVMMADGTGRQVARFAFRRNFGVPWGHIPGPDGHAPRAIVDRSGRPLYEVADFSAVLPGGESILDGAEISPWVFETMVLPAGVPFPA